MPLTPNGNNGYSITSKPKIYIAKLTQTSTNPPQATIIQNTIGNAIWTRAGTGAYVLTLIDAFPPDKTVAILASTGGLAYTANNNANEVRVNTQGIDTFGADEWLSNTPLTIYVY